MLTKIWNAFCDVDVVRWHPRSFLVIRLIEVKHWQSVGMKIEYQRKSKS